MATIELSDGVTAHELAGPTGGPMVLLLHGGTMPMWSWDLQISALHAAGFRTLRYDMYGKGHSALPAAAYDRALFRRQLVELLAALEVHEPLHLVGYSFGAAVAANFCVVNNSQVKSLALIAPVLRFADSHPMMRTARMPVAGQLFVQYVLLGKAGERASKLWEGSPDARRYAELFQAQLLRPGFDRAFAAFLRSDALDDYAEVYREVGRRAPRTLLLWGERDADIPREHIELIRGWIPDAQSHQLDGVGHGLLFQASAVVNQLLVDHLVRASA